MLILKLILDAKRSISSISFLDSASVTTLSLISYHEIQQSKYFGLYRKAMSFLHLYSFMNINVFCDTFLFNVETTDVLSTFIGMHMLFRILQYVSSARYAVDASNSFLCDSDSAMS